MTRPIMIDLRNIYPPTDVAQHGFLYRSIEWPPAMGLEIGSANGGRRVMDPKFSLLRTALDKQHRDPSRP